jgi:hypothetical protein
MNLGAYRAGIDNMLAKWRPGPLLGARNKCGRFCVGRTKGSTIMSTSVPKVSFTIRRPSPASRATSSGADSDNNSSCKIPRHLANDSGSNPCSPVRFGEAFALRARYTELDSSDDDDEKVDDELVTGFDQFGVQRCVSSSPHHFHPSSLSSFGFSVHISPLLFYS